MPPARPVRASRAQVGVRALSLHRNLGLVHRALLPFKVAVEVVHHTGMLHLLSTGLLHRLTFFSSIKYCIGGIEYSANDIEHGILRGNRPSPASPAVLIGRPQWAGGYFKQNDPRMQQVRRSLVLCACRMALWLSGIEQCALPAWALPHLGLPCIKRVHPPCTSCQHLGLPCT